MSYDIALVGPMTKQTLHADTPHNMTGGTYRVGGTTELSLNITYNYYELLHRVINGGIRSLYGTTGAESIPVLGEAIAKLGDDVNDDYWKATEGNVKAALYKLKALAQLRPDGVWNGD